MKKLITNLSLFTLLLTGIIACRKQPPVVSPVQSSRSFSLNNFTKLDAGNNFEIIVTKGASFSITATGKTVDVNDLKAEVVNDELQLKYAGIIPERSKVNIRITMPSLKQFKIYNKSRIDISNFTETSAIQGSISDHSKATISLTTPTLKINVTNSSEVIASGSAEIVEVEVTNTSLFNSYAVPAKHALVVAGANSIVRIFTSNILNAASSGNSRIYYKGNPGNLFLSELDNSQITVE